MTYRLHMVEMTFSRSSGWFKNFKTNSIQYTARYVKYKWLSFKNVRPVQQLHLGLKTISKCNTCEPIARYIIYFTWEVGMTLCTTAKSKSVIQWCNHVMHSFKTYRYLKNTNITFRPMSSWYIQVQHNTCITTSIVGLTYTLQKVEMTF